MRLKTILSIILLLLSICIYAKDDEQDPFATFEDTLSSSSSSQPKEHWYPEWLAITITAAVVALPQCIIFTVFFCKNKRTVQYK